MVELVGGRLGIIGETVVKLDLLRRGFEVYIGDDNTTVDMIAMHLDTSKVLKLEVKTTRRRNESDTGWIVDIRKSYGDLPFDHEDVDFLAVYLEVVDTVVYLPTASFKETTQVTIKDNSLKKSFDLNKDLML